MFAIVLLASWFSFFDTPMEKFADQYCGEIGARLFLVVADLHEKYDWEWQKFNTDMSNPSRFSGINPEVAGKRDNILWENKRIEMAQKQKYIDAENKRVIDMISAMSKEYSMRKKAFIRKGDATVRTQQEELALQKFKKGKCKLSMLSEEEKSILHKYFLRYSEDYQQTSKRKY